MISIETNKKILIEKLQEVSREGIDELVRFLKNSDFFTAPASTRYHGDYEGGLAEHSLNVYHCLNDKKEERGLWGTKLKDIDNDTITIVALLHDICKTHYYTTEMRNKKIDGQWVQVPYYTVDDKIPYGHGEKSVMMIEEYIKLKPVERYAIRWHMGAYSGQQDWGTLAEAMKKYPLVLALHEADMECTYVLESEEKQ